jgi:ArsR family transcriptional regulator
MGKGDTMSGISEQKITKTLKAPVNMKRGSIFTGIGKEAAVAVNPIRELNRDPLLMPAVAKAKSVDMSTDNIVIDKAILHMLAELCKTLSSPKRIEILSILKNDEKSVMSMVATLGVSKANASQHLAVMRHRGILATRRDGTNIYYRVTNHKIIDACMLMKEVLLGQYAK